MYLDLFPEPVPLSLAGSVWLVSQYQIRDLAALESMASHPARLAFLHDLADATTNEDAGSRRARLRSLHAQAERGFDVIGPSDAMATPAGRVESLRRSLAKAHEGLTPQIAVDLAVALTPGEWATFDRIAWHADLIDEVAGEIDREIGVIVPDHHRPDPNAMRKTFFNVIELTGYTPDQIGALYLSQWDVLLSAGDPREHASESPRKPVGWTKERFDIEIMKPRREFWREDKANG